MRLYWSVLFLIISHRQVSSFFLPFSFSDLKALAEFAYDAYGKFEEVYGVYESNTAVEEASIDDVLKEVRNVANKVEEMGAKIERHIDEAVATLLQRLPLEININAKKYELHDAIVRIDDLFDNFILYSADSNNFNKITIERFINTVTSDDGNGLKHSLSKMQRLFVTERTSSIADSLFTLINDQTKIMANEICDTGSTPQLQLYQLYVLIMKTHIRGFLMISFANLMLEVVHKMSFQGELKKAERRVIKRAKELMAAVKAEMRKAPRDMRRCDPPVHKRGETFLEFSHFMQGFIANEKKLNEENSCGYTCSTQPKPVRMQFFHARDDRYRAAYGSCDGEMLGCSYGGSAAWEICTETEEPRHYSYFVDGYGDTYGKKRECTGWSKKTPRTSRDQIIYDCDFCKCTCVRDGLTSKARRFISLKPQIADIKNNKVMTGVRFIEKDEFIHIQIKEGVLQPDGRIESDSEAWKQLDTLLYLNNMTMISRHVYVVKDRHALRGYPGKGYDRQAYGRDFAVLKYKQRQINLDDLFAPPNHVVTGIRFQHPTIPKASENQPIEIAIHVTPFNYALGTLEPTSEDIWVTPDPGASRTKLDLEKNNKNPINSVTNPPDSKPNSYVEVRNSDWWEDAAQSTIPFLDNQPVEGKPGFALGGISLFHRGAAGFGGFLALKIFSLDLPEYMSEEVPEELILS